MEGDCVESLATIKNIERELICPACKELFTHPLILPCQHSICHKCVKEILLLTFDDSFNDVASESSCQSSPRLRVQSPSMDKIDRINRAGLINYSGWKRNSLTPRTTTFPCPGCEHDIDLGERGINGLFRNFTLETIVERYRQAARAATAIMCDLCKPPPQESTKSCMDCSASYCNECFKIYHPWGTVKAQHEYVGPTTNFRPKLDPQGVDIPEINEEQSKIYNNALICWHHPEKKIKADSYILEYRKISREEEMLTWSETEVYSTSKVISDLESNSSYAFRVRGYKGSVCSPCSREVILHTPPASVFSFLFDEKCGYNNEHLLLNLKRDRVDSRAGFSLLLAAERVHVGCYTSLDYIIGDTGITKGKHFWALRVEPYSYMVKVGVASNDKLQEWLHNPRDISSPRYEQDSGHDSGSEDTCFDSSQPFTLVTVGMKKFFVPKSPTSSNEPENRVLPMPACIGIFLDYDKGKVGFYDADHMKCLYERQVDCSGTMYPAFALMGSGGIQLEEPITAKYLEYQDNL
ncbi:E3 ubiquitin-protein ligase TRIM36 [Gracilinanus agilis]|uniref:E3 ubiquitin-protein ligase TRIM36 n=1 Tax=Gracilinanus agilis TaxID=191870 RepID=UPI001CFCFBBB|nr:E3 ubiquitin-protein ligase TRIM36 [Gracilinanus agilis]